MSDKLVNVIVNMIPKGGEALAKQAQAIQGGASGGASSIVGAVGGFASAAYKAASPVLALVGVMNALGKAASPAAAARQERAWNDLSVVLGRVFLPVTEAVTKSIRGMADVLATVTGAIPGFVAGLQKIGGTFAEKTGLAPKGDVAQIRAIQAANPEAGARALQAYAAQNTGGPGFAFVTAIKSAMAFRALSAGASEGASGFNAQYSTGNDFARQQNIAALAAVGGGSAAERTADATKRTADAVEALNRNQQSAAQREASQRGAMGSLNG